MRNTLWNWIGENKITTLFITGHSLGGALSTICAFDFADIKPIIIQYSFAAPRSGIMADPHVRALARALKYYENSDSYGGPVNGLNCYGAYQFCPFGAWAFFLF